MRRAARPPSIIYDDLALDAGARLGPYEISAKIGAGGMGEAEALALLNHPNIAQIYGLEEADGIKALVMELVEGPTLADRVGQGPIPVVEALPLAKQIAEALEAAHEKNIIHRDLKPANIKVTLDAKVKILDFGLAAVSQDANVIDVNATHSPTLTLAATRAGVILGTAAYMSPEQAP
jgi:serine/threonine protein kinase